MKIRILHRCLSLAAPLSWVFVATTSIFFAAACMTPGSMSAQTAPAAAGQQMPVFGAWKLNAAKCDFGGGPVLRAMVLEFTSATADSIEFTATATYENGAQGTYSYKAPADGKDHKLVGSESTYAYSVENGVLTETQKDSDGTLTKGTFTRSANGKEGIWLYTITNPDKSVIHQKLVFTKTA